MVRWYFKGFLLKGLSLSLPICWRCKCVINSPVTLWVLVNHAWLFKRTRRCPCCYLADDGGPSSIFTLPNVTGWQSTPNKKWVWALRWYTQNGLHLSSWWPKCALMTHDGVQINTDDQYVSWDFSERAQKYSLRLVIVPAHCLLLWT